MRHIRAIALFVAVTLWAGLVVSASASPATGAAPADGAMSWWGYIIGSGRDSPGFKFIRQKQAAVVNANVVMIHVEPDTDRPALKRNLDSAKAQASESH
jgi:hypothetical protein